MPTKLSTNPKVAKRVSDPVVRDQKLNRFECECGKKYDSFPALYLHFKRVHHLKISSRVLQESCELMETSTQRIFTYYYSKGKENQKSDEGEFCFDNKFKVVLSNLFKGKQDILQNYPNYHIILRNLELFLQELIKMDNTYNLEKALFNLPLHLNDFVLENLQQEYWKEKYEENCKILLIIAGQLWTKKYSPYVLESNFISHQ